MANVSSPSSPERSFTHVCAPLFGLHALDLLRSDIAEILKAGTTWARAEREDLRLISKPRPIKQAVQTFHFKSIKNFFYLHGSNFANYFHPSIIT
jgi:hypothetical protein